jgi:DNA mismatch endonuclease (patch repair protein)
MANYAHSKEVRSYNMSRIRSKDTKPEEIVRKFLFSKGFRYRKNDRRYPGCPDIVLPKYRTVVFINGCFWHCHEGCSDFVIPKSNQGYWVPKLEKTASVMKKTMLFSEIVGGMCLSSGNANLKRYQG